jgi:hypothetical protein
MACLSLKAFWAFFTFSRPRVELVSGALLYLRLVAPSNKKSSGTFTGTLLVRSRSEF